MNRPLSPEDQAGWASVSAARAVVAVLLCDHEARVCALSAPAQAMLDAGEILTLQAGALTVTTGGVDVARAIGQVAAGSRPGQTLLVPAISGPALLMDITPLLARNDAAVRSDQVVVTVWGRAPSHASQEAVLQASFNLTAAEAAIAVRLVRGATRDAIAAGRGVSPGTLKSQIKSIYQKVGVTREVELAACLASLIWPVPRACAPYPHRGMTTSDR